ncbi:LmeA family phospholipid-binding protein [Humidisolicoccus flavus]|uniref:LmeA family phospholipid-binding protein n=1 Tax=Humidisolicoccus flavus TaxID=3111414 RepID=UPI0032469AC9
MRRRTVLISSGVVVLALGVGLWIGDNFARGEIEDRARGIVAEALDLDSPELVHAEMNGFSALWQLAMGNVSHIHAEANQVEFGEASGDLNIDMFGIPTNEVQPVGRVQASLALSQNDVLALTSSFVDLPVTSIELMPPDIRVGTGVSVLGFEVPLVILVNPSAENGEVALHVTDVEIDGVEHSLADAVKALGFDPGNLVTTDGFCLAQFLPEPLQIEDVRVSAERVTIFFGANGLTSPDLQGARGTC